jgi:6-phosphogluconolactonase
MPLELEIFDDAASLAVDAAERVVGLAEHAIRDHGEFAFCVSGGRTPKGVYEALARPERAANVDWQRVRIFFGDERCVPADDPASNYRMLKEALLEHVPIPPQNVFRIPTEHTPELDARSYDATLRQQRGTGADGAPERPFDLVFLGMGDDGHTASLFPGSEPSPNAERWASARVNPHDHSPRITLTEPVLNRALVSLFLITGKDKAARLAEVLEGPRDLRRLPAQRIAPSGRLGLMLDRAAASQLKRD